MNMVKSPVLLIHSLEDDLTSVKSSEFVYDTISSAYKQFIKLEDSYHVVTLDNEKKFVAEKTFDFIERLNSTEVHDNVEVAV